MGICSNYLSHNPGGVGQSNIRCVVHTQSLLEHMPLDSYHSTDKSHTWQDKQRAKKQPYRLGWVAIFFY